MVGSEGGVNVWSLSGTWIMHLRRDWLFILADESRAI